MTEGEIELGAGVVVHVKGGGPDESSVARDRERLADEVGAEFHELVLLDSKQNTLRRFAERSGRAADPAHVEAQEMLDRAGGVDELAAMYNQLVAFIATRPRAKIVPITSGRLEPTYRCLLDALG